MADRDSNERRSKISKKRPPEVLMNRDRMLRGGTATGCSDEQWPKAPTNDDWRLRRTMAGDSDQRRLKILKKQRPEVQMNEGQRLQGTAAGCSDKRRPEAPTNGG